MGRTVRLDTLRDDVRFRGDFGGATVRHSNAQLTRLINQSIQMFRERISDEGSTHYLVPYSGTLGVGPTSPYAFYQLDLSSGPSPALVRTYGVDVTIDGVVCKLDHVPFEARNDYGTISGGARPQAWAHFRTDQVAILPASSAAYPFTVWYLPKFTDLSDDADTFDGVAGWEEWVVWDVVCQVIARDQFPQAYAIAEQRRAEVEQRVIRGATKVSQAGGAHVGRDSFGSKLPHFLGGSRRTQAVAGGPYVPASGSVTNAMLADMTGPTVKAVMSGTTRPQDVQVATLTTYLSTFNTTQRGLVPPPLASSQLFLRDDGTWASAGGGAGGSVGPSGAIQYQAGTGMAGASGFRIHGLSGPSLVAHLDGTFKVTGGQVEVGSGTVRVSASGIDVGNGSIVNVGTLVASAIAAPSVTSTTAGLAPASGGGTTNFLRADGTWDAPPGTGGGGGGPTMLAGGAVGAIQYNSGSGLAGTVFASTVSPYISGSGRAMSWGLNAPSGSSAGGMNWGNATIVHGKTASGLAQRILEWRVAGSAGGIASGAVISYGNVGDPSPAPTGDIEAQRWSVRPSGTFHWFIGPSGPASMRLMETGLDARAFHVAAKSIAMTEGVASFTTALSEFSDTDRGVVPSSGGGTTNFLRADGSWSAPAGGTTAPSGPAFSVQFNSGGGFDGATGIRIGASGQAFFFGASGPLSYFNPAGRLSVNPTGTDLVGPLNAPTAVANFRAVTVASGISDSNLHPMGSGTVKGRITGTGTPADISIPTLHAFAPTFTATKPGTVPESGGGTTNFLRADGTWDVPPGTGGASSPGGDAANVQFRTAAGTFGGASGVQVVASGMALQFGLPNGAGAGHIRGGQSMSVYGLDAAGADVRMMGMNGSGTLEFGRSGIAARVYGDLGAQNLSLASGLSNANLRPMGSGTVKGNLGATGAPQDVPVATLFAAIPTFTSLQRGVVPQSGGGTDNYLRADGSWAVPPGGSSTQPSGIAASVQFRGAEGFEGATGIKIVASGQALAFGPAPASTGAAGGLRFSSLQTVHTRNAANDGDIRVLEMGDNLSIGDGNPTGNANIWYDVKSTGFHIFRRGYADNMMLVTASGADIGSGVLKAGALSLGSGVSNANLHPMGSGTVKGNLTGTGAPSDISIPTLHAFAPTFTSTRPGTVPGSGGGTTNFLRADGTWSEPPSSAGSTPGAAVGAVQFNNGAGGFGGASGVNIVGSGRALGFGVPSFLPSSGDIRVASGGLSVVHGPGAETMRFLPTGLDLTGFHVTAKSLDVLHINGLPTDANQLKRGIYIGAAGGTGVPSGLNLYVPGTVSSGANRFIIPSGYSTVTRNIILNPTGAKGGNTIRVERLDPGGALNFVTPTGTILYAMPSGRKHVADFVFSKPSGTAFEHGGAGDLF